MLKNDILTLPVTALSFEGFGIAKFSDGDLEDFVVFINGAVPGDTVRCRVVKVRRRYCFAKLEQIIVPAEDRIASDCDVFGKCGGCNFRHLPYEKELMYKQQFVLDAFRRQNPENLHKISTILPSPQQTGYRNKAQLPFAPDGSCGFYARGSHRCIPQHDCRLNDPAFDRVVRTVEAHVKKYGIPSYDEKTGQGLLRHLCIRRAPSTGEIMVCLVVNGTDIPHKSQLIDALTPDKAVRSIWLNINTENTNVIYGSRSVLLWGAQTITDRLCGLTFSLSPLSFYQINSPQAENIYTFVRDNAGFEDHDVLLDLYCGVGTIGLVMADRVKKVIGVEISKSAVDNAQANAQANKITNAVFYAVPASESRVLLPQTPTAVIVDPPRKGLDEKTVSLIKTLCPEKFIYISCNPGTLARDLAAFEEYEIRTVQPFDMFPRTSHVECACILQSKKGCL